MEAINCSYCDKGERLAAFAYEICQLPASMVFLFKEQSHPGRCVVAFKQHKADLTELSLEERAAFLEDCVTVSKAIKNIFSPDKINYGAFGDKGSHLHMHIVPKYKDGFEWGSTFAMNPKTVNYNDEMCAPIAEKIKAELMRK